VIGVKNRVKDSGGGREQQHGSGEHQAAEERIAMLLTGRGPMGAGT